MAKSHSIRVVVGTSDCDILGHLNVARYFALCNQCGFAMQTAMGWVPGDKREGRRLSFAVVRAESDFHAEVLEGEVLIVTSDIVRIGSKSASFRNTITRQDGSAVFSSVWHSACLNLDTRRADVIPETFRTVLKQYLAEDAEST